MNTPPAENESLVSAENRVRTDLPCMQCSYNLRTLLADARCPECGRNAADTIAASFQRRGRYATNLADGASSLTMGLIFLPVILPPVCLASLALLGFGLLAVTHPDPALRATGEGLSWRRVLRAMLLAIPLCLLGVFTGVVQLGWMALAIVAAVPSVLMLHLRTVSKRFGMPELARLAAWSARLAALAALFLAAWIADASGSLPPALAPLMIPCQTLGPILGLLLFILGILFFTRMREALEEHIGQR